MKNQLKNHSIIKVILLSIYLTVFLESCMLSAQNTKAQKIEQTEQSHVELTQALFTAVTNRLIDEAENLIAQGAEANGVDAYGSTPLHIAVSAGHVDIVKLLITHGARLDIKDNTGRTPLHYAAGANIQAHPRVEVPQKRLLDMLQVLLDNGADVNVKDNSGLIPLRYAIQLRDAPIVTLLVARGSDLYSVDNYGYSPYSWLREQISFWETCKGDSTSGTYLRQRAQESKAIIGLLQDSPRQYFVATNGDDLNPGTEEHPFESIEAAIDHAGPGDVIFIRGGVYYPTKTVHLNISGEYAKPICLYAYYGEHPVLDFSRGKDFSLLITGSYWHLKGLMITGGYRGIFIMGSEAHHNILEQVTSSAHNYTGFSMRDGIADNIILNCDSYANFDPQWNGEYPDGFEIRFDNGEGNILIGNRAWNNADDGYDFTGAAHAVRLEWCYASNNGENIWNYPVFYGDGAGFKCNDSRTSVPHFLIYCVGVAWDNSTAGFADATVFRGRPATFYNCIAYRNLPNYHFETRWRGIVKNNIGFKVIDDGEDILSSVGINQHNSWNSEVGITLTANDFLSLDDSKMTEPRNPDGSIPENNFLRLAPTSAAIDKGVDIGMPFVGQRPDLGAFEYDPNGVSGSYIKMLHQYVRDRNIEKIKELLGQGEDIDGRDWLGYTPLQWAVYFGYPDVVELLLSRGANPDIQSTTGRYALEIARAMAYADIESLLRQHGATADVPTATEQEASVQGPVPMSQQTTQVEEGTNGLTQAFFTAVTNGRVDEVENLIAQGADVNVVDELGRPLLFLAVLQENVDIVKLLVEHGARFDVKSPNGTTLLDLAVWQGMQDIVKIFLSHGVDTSSLHIASCVGDLVRVRTLIEQGADINAQDEAGLTPLLWAAVTDQADVAEYLLVNGASMDIQTSFGLVTLLELAIRSDSVRVVQLAISYGADVNVAMGRLENTPLFEAKSREMAELLIDNGADVNARNRSGLTPLHIACTSDNKDLVALLLAKGADITATGRGGRTALDLARAQGYDEIVKLLTEYKSEISGQETGTKEQQTTKIKP